MNSILAAIILASAGLPYVKHDPPLRASEIPHHETSNHPTNQMNERLKNYHRVLDRREYVALLCAIPPTAIGIIYAIRFIVNLFY